MLIFPLSILLGVEAFLAALLCVPWKPMTRGALALTGILRHHVVQIICATSGGILLLVLFFSVLRMNQLRDVMVSPASASGAATVFHEARQELYSEGIQASLIVSCLLLGMAIVRLDDLLRRNQKLQMNFDTMLKQAKGTQQEYMRQLSEKAPAAPAAAAAAASTTTPGEGDLPALRKENSKLKGENERLYKDARSADANVAAIRKQTEGLQLEFNRLMEENESLRAQLAIFDRKYAKSEDKKRS